MLLPAVFEWPGAAAHPLDPLSRSEIATAVSVLEARGLRTAATRFALVDLDEPGKASLLTWRPGQPETRRAFIVARRARTVYEGIVDLNKQQVERWRPVPKAQSRILGEEWASAQRITIGDSGWQAAMRRHGHDPTRLDVFCAPLSAGYSGDPFEEGRRLLKVTCFNTSGTRNVWSRPIEGLVAVVDLDEQRVVGLIDTGPVPNDRDSGQIDAAPQPTSRPSPPPDVRSAIRSDIRIDGNTVQWRKWSFHYRMDARSGLVLSLVSHADQGRRRLILYRGSLAEIFVPYMDPDPGWSFRAYLDVGEWGLGPMSLPLTPGRDCPADAHFLGATFADADGNPVEREGVVCVFERNTGAPLWRHAEIVTGDYHGQLATELVIRTIPTLGNYDYVVDWVLTEAGAIRIDVGATGIDQVKGVRARTMADPTAARDTRHGTLVAPNLVGVNHDHFVSFRLDLDIDGQANTLVRRRLVGERLPGGGGRRSLWRVADRPVAVEGPLAATRHDGAETWRIENPTLTNRLGQHPGYELRIGHTVTSMLAADDWPQRRAGFSAAPLWVTRYDPRELYAAGPYPNQSRSGGLPDYAARRRGVANADIVLWYTMGFRHIPRPEDWPVMPTLWHSALLIPDGFFEHNPTLDPPPDAAGPQPEP